MQRTNIVVVIAALALAAPAGAQVRGRGNDGIPPGQRPAAGLCRIWLDGVPPGQQPAPTDCRTANARVPRNGRVIYGDQTGQRNRQVYESAGQVVTINGQRCVQRPDRNGTVRTVCADGDHDRDDRTVARADRQNDGRFDRNAVSEKKHKHGKHKHDKPDKRDGHDDRNDRNDHDAHFRR